jgi:CheY-like chemotaxis protein
MDGLSAIRLIREHEAANQSVRTPIMVLSANVMREHKTASEAAGADGHLGKPFRAEELIQAIVNLSQADDERLVLTA